MEKIYYNLANDKAYREDGTDIANNNKPAFTYKTERDLAVQFLNSMDQDASGNYTDVYTGWVGKSITASVAIDNNYKHYFSSAVETALTAGTAVSSVALKDVSGAPRIAGSIKITNSAGESETAYYNGFTESNGVYTFATADSNYTTANFTPTYSYAQDDAAKVVELPIIKTQAADVDTTDKDTGLLSFPINSDTLIFGTLVEGSSGLENTNLEIQIFNSTPQLEWAKEFGVLLKGIIDDEGDVGPAPASDYYTKAETSALVNGKADKVGTDDIQITDSTKGFILQDRTTGTNYRLFIDNNIIGIESV